MKRLLIILSVFIFFFYSTGYYMSFIVLQKSIRGEMKAIIKAGLKEENLTKIYISYNDPNSTSDFKWYEKGKEFFYKGNLYDVVKTEVEKDGITYLCINDSKEEKLLSDYSKFSDFSGSKIPLKQKTQQIIQILSINATLNGKHSFADLTNGKELFFAYFRNFTNQFLNSTFHPPKFNNNLV